MRKNNQKASLKISQDVVETIARVAALEVDGIAAIADIDSGYHWSKHPIDIKISEEIAEISIRLVLQFGAKISEVCEAVQKTIKENVQTMTGIMVSKVHISVEGISLPIKEEKASICEE